MREILFRGKTIIDNEWVIGAGVYKSEGYTWIITDDVTKTENRGTGSDAINPETVGQYTGLTDKNGNKIFEGDIIRYDDLTMVVRYGRIGFDSGIGLSGFALTFDDDAQETDSDTGEKFYECERGFCCKEAEVIGNIHDNSELLKGERNEAD